MKTRAPLLLLSLFVLAGCQSVFAGRSLVCGGPGTLFQWSYGTVRPSGPNLNEPLVTDRPDFTEASSTVGIGVTQFEAGYVYVNNRGEDSSFEGHAYPDLLVRRGVLANWLELRASWTYLSERQTIGDVTESDDRSSDLLLGMKLGLTPQLGCLPEMALIPQMFVPISKDPILGGGEVLPGINWLYSWELSDCISMGGSSQLNRALDDETGDAFGLFAQSWVFGITLTERLGSYVEWFALVPDGADTVRTQHYGNGGFTYLISNNIQFDIRAGVGLSEASDDFFAGTGLSVRFP